MQKEVFNQGEKHNELERVIAAGIYGAPEIKRDEKSRFLGEFRERIIKRLTKKQVADPGIYPEIIEALKSKASDKLIIHGEILNSQARKYERLAARLSKNYSIRHDPDFKGDTGLVVASNDAVDVEDIEVQDREERLKSLGIPVALIQSAGKKICKSCLNRIVQASPGEAENYNLLTVADHFWGEQCPACAPDK